MPKDEYYAVDGKDGKGVLKKLLKAFKDIPDDVGIDIFGEIYEYFLGKFALAEGQGGGEFFTPSSVVRYMVEVLAPTEGEIFDLLQKEKLTKEELKKVKLAAKELYQTLTNKKSELFIVGWEKDEQPKKKVRKEIMSVLDQHLPDSYDREIFTSKLDIVFAHIIDQAMMGMNWVA